MKDSSAIVWGALFVGAAVVGLSLATKKASAQPAGPPDGSAILRDAQQALSQLPPDYARDRL